jgi:hypothetical protein
MTARDPLVVQHGCAALIAFCFWGSFRLSRATKGHLATTRHAPLVMIIGGLVMAAAAYSHEAIALYVASLVLCLMDTTTPGQRSPTLSVLRCSSSALLSSSVHRVRGLTCGPSG